MLASVTITNKNIKRIGKIIGFENFQSPQYRIITHTQIFQKKLDFPFIDDNIKLHLVNTNKNTPIQYDKIQCH